MPKCVIQKHLERIAAMSRAEMACYHRFAEPGHPYFCIVEFGHTLRDAFQKRWAEFGGMTPEISKSLGWSQKVIKWNGGE